MKTIGLLTSGGDAPGMNAAIRAIVRSGIHKGFNVMGIKRGYEGLIDNEMITMEMASVGDILHRGGTALKTARSERFLSFFGQKEAISNLEKAGIDTLIVIGGDGSFRGAEDLSKEGIKVIGIPGTIDNDMGYTDYTIGFDTAVNTVLDAIGKIRDTASSHDRTTIVEVMGRHCGDIALYAGVAGGAESILIPEIPVDIDAVCNRVKEGARRNKEHSIIIKAEGVEISTEELAKKISQKAEEEVRSVVLAYLQRGGSPTARDAMLAGLMGAKAVELADGDWGSCAVGIVRNEIEAFPLNEAIKVKREANLELLHIVEVLSK